MRGKVKVQVANKLVAGITPAYAGKRAGRCPDGCTPWDHPRVCGEKCSSVRSASHRRGSPPRMRGKDLPFTCDCESTGITPACAGKRCRCIACRACIRDHPRVCGEKACVVIVLGHHFGITPACAGKRGRAAVYCGLPEDHPRVCGEKRANQMSKVYSRGSPPRVRGKERISRFP